ncbi:hypothetical protein PRIC2_012196 [Phytophthora ramorum]
MESKPEQGDYYLRETLLEHGRSTDHNGIVVGSWKTEFFDCFDDCVPNGFMAIVSPVVSMAQISKRLGLAPYSLVITVYLGLSLPAGPPLRVARVSVLHLRMRRGGDDVRDMATRMASYEPGTCSFGPRATLEGYVHQ